VVLKHLASGGMADVLLGRSDGIEGFERHVVLKRIRAELARDPRFIRMFLDEARVVATLHHQNIVQVHDIGEADGEYFIAMEYVHGEDARKILSSAARQDTHVPLGHAVAIVAAAASGLHYAHERRGSDRRSLGIVHRDVSPSNILVGHDGSIKVVDFGIATASAKEETRSGSLKGKLAYMSPEQCKGIAVDRRSDVYGLGVVLYELATTTPMIRGDSDYLVMEQIVEGRITLPERRRPGLPSELQDIIMRALATDRERRYATADDLRIALDQFAANVGLTASTSAIAAYMRRQFGQPPEPWLAPDIQIPVVLDDDSPYHEESRTTWIESPSGEAAPHSASLAVIASDGAPGLAAPASTPRPPAVTAVQSTQIPTDSRMGWESVPRTPLSRGSRARKVALLVGAMVAGVAIWIATRSTSEPVTSLAAPIAAHAVPPVAEVVPTTADRGAEPTLGGAAVAPIGTASPQRAAMAETAAPQRAEAAAPASPPGAMTAAASPQRADVAAAAPPQPGTMAAAGSPERAEVAAAPSPQRAEAAHPESPAQRKQRTAITTRSTTKSGLAAASASARNEPPARVAVVGSTASAAHGGEVAVAEAGIIDHPMVATPPAPAIQRQPPTPSAPAAPAPAVEVARLVSPPVLDANRIAGDRQITPDEITMAAISRSGRDTVMSLLKVCVAPDGRVHTVTQLRATGFPAYDTKIQDTIRRDWRYRPYLVDGKPVPVCTAFKFVYSQK
jgi:serine/threonine protein kinase